MLPRYKLLLFLILPLLAAFSIEPDERSLTIYKPVLFKKSDLASSIYTLPASDFSNPGKIYIYGNYIYLVDLYTGIHVIDNQNSANPTKTGFIHIPGVVDLAIRNQVLYADNAIDLVAIDISNFPEIRVTERLEAIFPEHTPPDLEWIPHAYSSYNRPANTVIVGWVKKQRNR